MAAKKKATTVDPRKTNANDVTIGERVRTRRLEIGMSQTALGQAIGTTFQQVQKYEKGMNRIAASTLIDIADALDVPNGYLLEGLKPIKR